MNFPTDLRRIDLNLLVRWMRCWPNATSPAPPSAFHQPAGPVGPARQVAPDLRRPLLPAETSRGMTPTARALAWPRRCARPDLEAVVCHQPSFDPSADVRTFQIAANDNAMTVIGLPLIEKLAAHAGPGVRIARSAPRGGADRQPDGARRGWTC